MTFTKGKKYKKPTFSIQHFQISRSDQIREIIDTINEKYGVRNLIAAGIPIRLYGNHKILTLKFLNRHDVVVRISGPDFIIEDIYTIWFAKFFGRTVK